MAAISVILRIHPTEFTSASYTPSLIKFSQIVMLRVFPSMSIIHFHPFGAISLYSNRLHLTTLIDQPFLIFVLVFVHHPLTTGLLNATHMINTLQITL